VTQFEKVSHNNLLDVSGTAAAAGVPAESIHHLVTLRIIKPIENDPEHGPLFSTEQIPVLEILSAMSILNFRIEEMRDMVRVMETLGRYPASETASRYRIRLGMFAEALQRRPVVTTEQQISKQDLIHALTNRYTWLTA
jgi:DNA-binding transcriptional MerR regulator